MEYYYVLDDSNYNYIRDLLVKDLKSKIIKKMKFHRYKDIMILCFGTDKNISDSYGPRVGSKLIEENSIFNERVFGIMGETLNATNIHLFINKYKNEIKRSLVISVDAIISLSFFYIGSLFTYNEGIKPGAGLGKEFPLIGDISICGVISNEHNFIPDHDEEMIIRMSDITADALSIAVTEIIEENKSYNGKLKEYPKLLMKMKR